MPLGEGKRPEAKASCDRLAGEGVKAALQKKELLALAAQVFQIQNILKSVRSKRGQLLFQE
jgi:hypothetical protein